MSTRIVVAGFGLCLAACGSHSHDCPNGKVGVASEFADFAQVAGDGAACSYPGRRMVVTYRGSASDALAIRWERAARDAKFEREGPWGAQQDYRRAVFRNEDRRLSIEIVRSDSQQRQVRLNWQ